MKKVLSLLVVLLMLAAGSAMAATFEFHGDLNNRFNLYTNHADLYSGFGNMQRLNGKRADGVAPIGKDKAEDTWGEIKYRLWTEAATNDGKIKGVYAIEIGAVRYGNKTKGGAFSGDGINVETRWAYTDFQLPGVSQKARVRMGLQPFKINGFLWQETAMGVALNMDNLHLSWMRGKEAITSSGDSWGDNDLDALTARYDLKQDNVKAGFFASYMFEGAPTGTAALDPAIYEIKSFGTAELNVLAIGTDGSFSTPTGAGDFFVKWDAIYENGSIDNYQTTNGAQDVDLSAYLVHADVGLNLGKTRLTYTGWYASGDDNSADQDLDAFLSVDVDRFDSVVLFEGGYTDDNAPTEMPYLLDKGFIMNKVAVDHKATDKLTVGGAVLYMLTAEDITYSVGSVNYASDTIGVEVDAYVKYKLYPNCEVALNAGYLAADDAMDYWEVEQNGKADEDIFRTTARVRYKF
ncbi:hypothetical protein [Geothermobacter hydrogeniphilus]|uniref:Alginate export domain-containing protein n=1 Tax=Geothermobacter hydrogeniphilus TaxID=1969733 RepID=A0A1X0YAD5_9BACT|nr:hypothetical protein [Geothermobacter hydrogeniphilus]ORJ62059.1 hypothetical protein B5V00_04730 [Geothermobacter hydrogeniphilus]